MKSCVCTDFEGGCWATVFLHSNIAPERVLARIVGLEACLSDRPGCVLFWALAERE